MKYIYLILILFITSCEIENGQIPCGNKIVLEWNIKSNPIIKVPVIGCLEYNEIKALLYNDFDEHKLLYPEAKQDTVILDAINIDLSNYQKCMQICEIYLIN